MCVKTACRLTVRLVVGDIARSVWGDDDGQYDEAEHQQEDDQVEQHQEAQEGEIGEDSRSKHSLWNGKEREGETERNRDREIEKDE